MASGNEIEFLSIKEKGNGRFDLALSIESVKRHFEVSIIDRDGVFGVDMPDELGLMLRNFPHSQKQVVRSVQLAWQKAFPNRQLQAA